MYTVGHSVLPFDEFVALVTGAGIEVIADVRRFPRSRRHPQFARANFEANLPIAYEWLGDDLGGFREGGYEDWMQTADFERGLDRLERLEGVVAFMCAEGVPAKCHRLYVARALVSRGRQVAHLLPGGRIEWEQTSLPDR